MDSWGRKITLRCRCGKCDALNIIYVYECKLIAEASKWPYICMFCTYPNMQRLSFGSNAFEKH